MIKGQMGIEAGSCYNTKVGNETNMRRENIISRILTLTFQRQTTSVYGVDTAKSQTYCVKDHRRDNVNRVQCV